MNNLKNNKFFSVSLYRDALRQLQVVGIVFLIIMCFPIFFDGILGYTSGQIFPISVSSFLSCYAMAPIMTRKLFGFLYQRNSSDFYHSIPHSRICIYITYVSAIITWIFLTLSISTAFGYGLVYLERVFHHPSDPTPVACLDTCLYLLAFLFTSLLIVAAITIGMSVSGTSFTGLAITLMVLFLPSIFRLFMRSSLMYAAPVLSQDHIPFLNPGNQHIISKTVSSFFNIGYFSIDELFTPSELIYTLIIALIYCGIGGCLFYLRKSECAGFSTVYPWVQTLSRCACCLTFTLIILSYMISQKYNGQYYSYDTFSSDYAVYVIFMYTIAIFIYFLFELISTRKVKNLIKAIPGLGIVAALDIALYLLISLLGSYAMSFSPEPEEIDYVILDLGADDEYHISNKYYTDLISNIKIRDEEVCFYVAEALADNLKAARNHELDTCYPYSSDACTFGICVNGTVTYRTIQLTRGKISQIFSCLYTKYDILEQYFSLPDAKDKHIYLSNADGISESDTQLLYQCLLEEIDTLSSYAKRAMITDVNHYSFLSDDIDISDDDSLQEFYLNVQFRYKNRSYVYSLPITNQTPKTYNYLLSLLSEHTQTYLQSADSLQKISMPNGIRLYTKDNQLINRFDSQESRMLEFAEAAKTSTEVPTVSDNFFFIEHVNTNKTIGVVKFTDELEEFLYDYYDEEPIIDEYS